MKTTMLILTGVMMLAQTAWSAPTVERKLFTLEKSYNPENILIIHAQTDENCKFVQDEYGYVDYYWLMNKADKKLLNMMIRSSVEDRVKFAGIDNPRDTFKVALNDLSEIKHDLESNTIEARAEINNGTCAVKAIIQLGASAKYKKLNLKRVFCEVKTNLVGIPSGCSALELSGTDEATGEALKVSFKGK